MVDATTIVRFFKLIFAQGEKGMNIGKKALLYIAEPIIIDIFKDILKSTITTESLLEIREKLHKAISDLTGKTATSIDDELVKALFSSMTNRSDRFKQVGDVVLDAIEKWVAASETKWDDKLLLPVLVALREAADIPDEDE